MPERSSAPAHAAALIGVSAPVWSVPRAHVLRRGLDLPTVDQILVLRGGTVVQRGMHIQLLHQDGFYRELYELQLKDQELEERVGI